MTRLADAYDALAEAAAALALELRAADADYVSKIDTRSPEALQGELDALPFDDTPQGRSAQGGCPVHGLPWSVREAGISKKTGEPYRAFWKCDGQNADGSYCQEKPTLAWVKAHPAR
jgi:hypothetical protein